MHVSVEGIPPCQSVYVGHAMDRWLLRGIHTARRTAPRSAASNSEIETGAIRAAKSYGALLLSLCTTYSVMIQRRSAPCGGAVQRRTLWSVTVMLLVRERSTLADPYCHLAWNSVGVFVFVFVGPQL